MTRWCNNWNVLHLRFAHFQRVIDSANSQNVLTGMNFIKVILPIGGCHCLANKVECLIRLHLEKRDSDSDKGPRKTDDYGEDMDELDYAIRLRMMQDASLETVTLRHTASQRALPLRQHGSFLPGAGIGGAGEHWNAICPRFLPDCFELLSRTIEKYGPKRLPEDHAIQDWGVTYDELEPHYARVEALMGISGKAGFGPYDLPQFMREQSHTVMEDEEA